MTNLTEERTINGEEVIKPGFTWENGETQPPMLSAGCAPNPKFVVQVLSRPP